MDQTDTQITAPTTGNALFFGAIRDLISNPGAVLRIAAVPLICIVVIEAFSARAYVDWWNSTALAGPPLELARIIGFYLLVGVVAVGWHRFMILRESHIGPVPAFRPKNWVKYMLGWLVIGIVVGLATLLVLGLPIYFLVGLMDPMFAEMLVEVVAPTGHDWAVAPSWQSIAVVGLCMGAVLYFYLFCIFRVSMGLPAVAVDEAAPPGMRASWRRTRPIVRPIIGLTVIAMIAQGAFFWLYFSIYQYDADTQMTFAAEFTRRAASAVFDTLLILVGAAILTRLYRATLETTVAPPPL